MDVAIEAILRTIPGDPRPAAEPLVGQPVPQVKLDAVALSRHGLAARDVLDVVEAIGGKPAGEIRETQRRFPLVVKLPERYKTSPELLGTILVPAAGGLPAPPDGGAGGGQAGARLPLSCLATISRTSGPVVIKREWSKRRALVTCNVLDRALPPEDVYISWRGSLRVLPHVCLPVT